jgi:hypothetical protein
VTYLECVVSRPSVIILVSLNFDTLLNELIIV